MQIPFSPGSSQPRCSEAVRVTISTSIRAVPLSIRPSVSRISVAWLSMRFWPSSFGRTMEPRPRMRALARSISAAASSTAVSRS